MYYLLCVVWSSKWWKVTRSKITSSERLVRRIRLVANVKPTIYYQSIQPLGRDMYLLNSSIIWSM